MCFKYKIPRFLQLWCKLTTRRIVKTSSFRFLRDYYGESLDVMFPTVSHGVSACFPECFYDFLECFYCFSSVFPPFPNLDFAIYIFSVDTNTHGCKLYIIKKST